MAVLRPKFGGKTNLHKFFKSQQTVWSDLGDETELNLNFCLICNFAIHTVGLVYKLSLTFSVQLPVVQQINNSK